MDINFFIFRLKHLKGIGNKGLLRILYYYLNNPENEFNSQTFIEVGKVKPLYLDSFKHSYDLAEGIKREDFENFQEYYSFITIMDDTYPECLREIYNPPIALFFLGDISLLSQENILAVIGSREATPHGKTIIEKIIPPLCKKEIIIASGLAKGNDTFSHQAAIRHQGKTIGVIGSGLNCFYPKENERLQTFMTKEHLVLSEYLPNTKPFAYHFPARNRIIAGISKGTCVIEAKRKSGTFITAQLALEEGRDVFAVPGNPLTDSSEGCLHLIQEGAKCIWKAEDILSDWYLN